MPLIRLKYVTREHVRDNFPHTLYLFGDNMQRSGFGGQAKEMRGEPNAIGVPTKWSPHMGDKAFFTDADYDKVLPYIEFPFMVARAWLNSYNDVVVPTDGLGTGLSELPTRAPKIYKRIEACIADLYNLDEAL